MDRSALQSARAAAVKIFISEICPGKLCIGGGAGAGKLKGGERRIQLCGVILVTHPSVFLVLQPSLGSAVSIGHLPLRL